MSKRKVIPLLIYILFLLVPIYWLVNMSLKTNTEITSTFTLFPNDLTFRNYAVILTDPIFQGLAISLLFGLISSTLLTVLVIPAIYIVLRDDGRPLMEVQP